MNRTELPFPEILPDAKSTRRMNKMRAALLPSFVCSIFSVRRFGILTVLSDGSLVEYAFSLVQKIKNE